MLAIRRSSIRFWPKLKVDIKSHVLRPCSNAIHRCKTSLNFGSVRLVHSSSISKSSAKLTGEQLRHAEITSYVEMLNAQDVQLFLHALWLRRKVLPPPDADSSASDNKEAAARFALADLNGDGQLSKHEFERLLHDQAKLEDVPPSALALKRLFFVSMVAITLSSIVFYFLTQTFAQVPFVGFGCMDNGLMILFEHEIEMTIGASFHLSTMGCAAFGNLASVIVGVLMGERVEKLAMKLGLPPHGLSLTQLEHASANRVKTLGSVIGVIVGCLIGMLPLYWIDNPQAGAI